MTELKFDRIEMELSKRLRGAFNNITAEYLLQDRCLNAVRLCSIQQTGLFDDIIVNNATVIKSKQVVDVLKVSGVLDLVSFCINSHKEGKQ